MNFVHQNLIQMTSQHTETPIYKPIKTLLADFGPVRNIDDEPNHNCVECSLQFDDYDWMKQQTNEQESKLCHLLLSSDLKLKNPLRHIEHGNHNGLVFADELENAIEISVPQPQSPTHSSSSSLMSNRKRNFIPPLQSNSEREFVSIRKTRF